MTSHTLRLGAAAYDNEHTCLQYSGFHARRLVAGVAHQSLAYISITITEDQSIGSACQLLNLGQLITLRDELFQHVLGHMIRTTTYASMSSIRIMQRC
ncbi:Hypothetical protein PHPALM_38041 [Phytophthora palmivora]|uniref:Uncharacterized protein n=1 Tax=Phytophthora palmivora TaxID=4796 RepID=A0A2P4WVX1_9STRA|nr:Hypothetical protein PHPALM_38041 [Phytophthora palmivora]